MIKINFSLKQMLIGLVLIGISVVLVLSMINIKANNQLRKSQNWLTEIVLPLEVVNQKIQAIIADFIIREGQITAATTLKELEPLANQDKLEQAFIENENQLKILATKVAEITHIADAQQALNQLTTYYHQFRHQDSIVLTSVRNSLTLEQQITRQLHELHQLGTQLQIKAEAVFGKVNFFLMLQTLTIRKLLNTSIEQVPQILSQPELIQMQMACSNLTIATHSLGTYGHQLLLETNQTHIVNIKDNQIAQAFQLAESSVKKLAYQLAYSNELKELINQIEPQLQETVHQVEQELTTLVEEIEAEFDQFKSILIDGNQSVFHLQKQRLTEQEQQKQHIVKLRSTVAAIKNNLSFLRRWAEQIHELAKIEAEQTGQTSKEIVIIVSIIAILFIVITSTLLASRILLTINKVVSFAHDISKGDFTTQIQVRYRDEIGNLVLELSHMANNLSSLFSQIQRAGIQVTSSATELAATAKQQKATMLNQVESTNTVEKSVETISEWATKLLLTMQQVADLSTETAKFADHSQANLLRMAEAMQNMESASKSISNKLSTIHDKTENITTVVTTITKVADQTNLLSLNAAIEAEKAGEYGRGFNVVAREIRRLADQTAVATLDIEQMVKEMQLAVEEGVLEMNNFIKEVQQSAEDVGIINTQMKRIIEQVQVLSPRFEEINVAMSHQSSNVQQINQAMMAVGEGMRQTAESLEESFHAIEQLNEAARNLQYEVSRFKVKTEYS